MDYWQSVKCGVCIVASFFLGWACGLFRSRGTLLPQFIEFETEGEFIAWQQTTMMYTVVANGAMCEDGGTLSVDPERIYEMAKTIRERAREGRVLWSHDVEARAVDATVGWCARWLGMLPEPKAIRAPWDFEQALAEVSG